MDFFTNALLEKLNRQSLNRYQLHRSMWDYCQEKTVEEYSTHLRQVIDDLKDKEFIEECGINELTNPLALTAKGRNWLIANKN